MNIKLGFKLNVNTDLIQYLARQNYNIDDLIIVYCIENEDKELLESYVSGRNNEQSLALFQRFERKMIIERIGEEGIFNVDNYISTEKGASLLLECMCHIDNIDVIISESVSNIENPIDEFLEIYPKGRNKSGETLRSNVIDTKNKMKGFLKKYKYSKETILQATKNYIRQQALSRYEFCNAAHYFISKQGFGSKLANECDNVLNGNESISSFGERLM